VNRKEIKERAKKVAFNNKWNLWKPYVIYMIVIMCYSFISTIFELDSIVIVEGLTADDILGTIIGIALIPMIIGAIYNNMAVIDGKKLSLKDIFEPQYKKIVLIYITLFAISFLTGIFSILLIIPGIIYALKMSMARMILADPDYNNLSSKEIRKLSSKMMDGHKLDFVIFQLSFVLWILLEIVTFGIAVIWVQPYMQTAEIMYYRELKKLAQA